MCSRAFETRSRPPLSRRYPRGFAFYVAFPKSSIRPLGFAHLCRSRPRGSAHSLLPSSLYLDHSRCLVLAPATLAAFPSTRAIETRSLPTSLAATHRGFAFYVASPKSSIPDRDVFYGSHPIRSIRRCNGKRTNVPESSRRSWRAPIVEAIEERVFLSRSACINHCSQARIG